MPDEFDNQDRSEKYDEYPNSRITDDFLSQSVAGIKRSAREGEKHE